MYLFIVVLVTLSLTGCKIEIAVPETGRVDTQSGAYSCEPGETCIIDVVDIFFDEMFKAIPAAGYSFKNWRKKDRGFCGGKSGPCHLYTSNFEGSPLTLLLESNEVFYLEPVFAKQCNPSVRIYKDRDRFERTLGTIIVDTYDGYPSRFNSKAVMDAVLGETEYASTFYNPPNSNFINAFDSDDPSYCSGCNGTFRLTFTSTSVGDPAGVYGVGFDIHTKIEPFSAFVTFSDMSTRNYVLPLGHSFFGITDIGCGINNIHIARNNQITDVGAVSIDNLTIGDSKN